MSWEKLPLELATTYLKRGVTPKYVEENGYPIINQKCVRDNVVNFELARLSSKNKKIQVEKFLLEGDILVNSTGKGTLGRTGQVKNIESPSLVDTHVTIVRPDKERINPKFLALQLSGKEKEIESMERGATNQTELSASDLGKLEIDLPPLPTQQKIASLLSAYDDLIKNNLKRIKLLEEAAQHLYKEWFVNFRFPGCKNIPINKESGLPEGWKKVSLKEIYATSSGGTPKRSNPNFYEGGVKWFRTKELKDSLLLDSELHISEEAIEKSSAKKFPKGTVLMAMYGATIGRLGILTDEATTNQACCAIMPEKDNYGSNFLFYWLLFNREYILNFRMGAAQENISQTIIKKLEILKAEENLVKDFCNRIEKFHSMILNLFSHNERLKEAKNILLPRLMNRTIEV